MILSGAMFSFDKLNRGIGRVDKVPWIAEFMVTKWTYEALMVHQFKDNRFNKTFYEYDKKISRADYKKVYWIPELRNRLKDVNQELNETQSIDKTKSVLKVIMKMLNFEVDLADLDKEISKSKQIEESMRKIEKQRRKTAKRKQEIQEERVTYIG